MISLHFTEIQSSSHKFDTLPEATIISHLSKIFQECDDVSDFIATTDILFDSNYSKHMENIFKYIKQHDENFNIEFNIVDNVIKDCNIDQIIIYEKGNFELQHIIDFSGYDGEINENINEKFLIDYYLSNAYDYVKSVEYSIGDKEYIIYENIY